MELSSRFKDAFEKQKLSAPQLMNINAAIHLTTELFRRAIGVFVWNETDLFCEAVCVVKSTIQIKVA